VPKPVTEHEDITVLCNQGVQTDNRPDIIVRNNKKFWEELIRLLCLHKPVFEELEHKLMELDLSELTINSFN
jgi:hypothetical protein